MTSDNPTSATRKAAIAILSRGLANLSETARLAGVSPQLVRYWAAAARIDWRELRHGHLAEIWERTRRN